MLTTILSALFFSNSFNVVITNKSEMAKNVDISNSSGKIKNLSKAKIIK